MCKETKTTNDGAEVIYSNKTGTQIVSVNAGDVVNCIKNSGGNTIDDEPPYVSIGYFINDDEYTKDFPHADIDISINGYITIHDDMALVRHFGKNPAKVYELYGTIVPLINAAGTLAYTHEDILQEISEKLYNILIDNSVIEVDVARYNPRFVDLKYESKFLGFVRQWSGKVYNYKLIDLKNEFKANAPLLWLHRVTVGTDIEFLVYPDGSLIINNTPMTLHFDDIREFGGVRILEFCYECNRQYKLADGDLTKDGVYDGYEDLVKKLLHDLQYREL